MNDCENPQSETTDNYVDSCSKVVIIDSFASNAWLPCN